MKETLLLHISETDRILTIAKALSSKDRLQILELLDREVLNISEIASKLQLPMSSAAMHVRVLEEAGLVITQPLPGARGQQKKSAARVETVLIQVMPSYQNVSPYRTAYYSIPIGNYFDFQITPPCGIATENRFVEAADECKAFFMPEHSKAQLIWFRQGYLEYRIDTTQIKKISDVERVEFSFELCSEAPGYDNNWPSDITLWINGAELGTFTSEGDFGGERGKQNPVWWSDQLTQFGKLHTLSVRKDGCYIDEIKTSEENLSSLRDRCRDSILFRIGVKPDAENVGGMNLFGERFGNYSQHINVKVNYQP